MRTRTLVLVVVVVVALLAAYLIATSPDSVGGSSTVYKDQPIGLMSLVRVSQTTWDRKGRIRRIGHSTQITRNRTRSLTRATSGPCYHVDAEVHGDSKLIDHVVEGWLHAKLCMRAGDHTMVLDKYTNASSAHKETWMWDFQGVDVVKGAGVSTTYCNGGVGPCLPVEYRYWRFTFHWIQGVNIFGQTVGLHHKTLYVGCTLRAGNGGVQCGMGEA